MPTEEKVSYNSYTKRSDMIHIKYKSVKAFLRVPVCDGRIIPGLEWAGVCRDIYQYLAVSWCVFSGERDQGPGQEEDH